mgnify:CR=1 FL=1
MTMVAVKMNLTGIQIGKYVVSTCIQKGGNAKVYLAFEVDEQKKSSKKYALKHQRTLVGSEEEWKLTNEAAFYRYIGNRQSKGICKFIDLIEKRDKVFDQCIILEYHPTDFFTLKLHGFPEKKIPGYLRQIAKILDFLHSEGIIYRDLKLENLLLSNSEIVSSPRVNKSYPKSQDEVILCDFGSVMFVDAERRGLPRANDFAGTIDYIPPEMILGCSNSYAHDIWSYGVLVYELLSPNSPFADLDEGLTISNILSGEYEMPDCLTEYKNLISKCLEKDPLKRPSWKEIYQMLDEIELSVLHH